MSEAREAVFGTAIAAVFVTAIGIEIGTAASIAAIATPAPRAKSLLKKPQRRRSNGHGIFFDPNPPSVLPAPQDLPVLGGERAQDRPQGREALAALRIGARQDRAEPHHRSVGQEAARACAGDQTRTVSRPAALRDPLSAGRTSLSPSVGKEGGSLKAIRACARPPPAASRPPVSGEG